MMQNLIFKANTSITIPQTSSIVATSSQLYTLRSQFTSSNYSEEAVNCISERFKEDIKVPTHFNAAYIAVEIIIAIFAIFFNIVIIYLYIKNAYIRKSATNMYIISLATADFLVGLVGIPAAILTSIGLPENFSLCLISTSILLQICTTSIFNLVAVTMDRYMAILRPLRYQTLMSKKKVKIIIALCWIAGFFIGFIPLMGFNKGPPPEPRCFFLEVNNLSYLVFLYFSTIVFPSLFLACVYFQIHKEIRRQIRKNIIRPKARALSNKTSAESTTGRSSSASLNPLTLHQMSCVLPSWRAEVKVIRILFLIVTAFMVSWAPLYSFNTLLYFKPCLSVSEGLVDAFICLSHLNSVWNPLIYAFGTKDFKRAMCGVGGKCKDQL